MSLDQRLSIHDIECVLARGRQLLVRLGRPLASVADRPCQRVSAVLDHTHPDHRFDRPPRAAGIGARWHRW
jgi:hypothetical protein